MLEQATADPYATEATEIELAEPTTPRARRRRAAAPRSRQQPSLFDALDLDVALAVPSNLVLRGNDLRPANAPIDIGDMNVTVGGALQMRKAPGERARGCSARSTPSAAATRSRAAASRSCATAASGSPAPTRSIRSIDLRARRIISGVETFVRVQGTMRQPELSFSSNPPLDQADILSLIVFNQPINELGEGQQVSLAERAGALAGGYLASGLARSIGNALELDEFEIQAQGERGAGPELSVGEQVGEQLFFRIRQGFGDAQATELILEYQIADFLRLQGTGGRNLGRRRSA